MPFTTEPCHPPFTSTLPARQQPRVVGAFGVPHPGHPSSACPFSSQHLPLSLTTFLSLRPQGPLVQPPLPQGQLRAVSQPPRALPLQGSLPPRPGGFPDEWVWGKVGVTALGHHSLGSVLLMAQMPQPLVVNQRREEAPCLCHHPRGRGPTATSPEPAPATATAPPGARSLGAARRSSQHCRPLVSPGTRAGSRCGAGTAARCHPPAQAPRCSGRCPGQTCPSGTARSGAGGQGCHETWAQAPAHH